MSFRVVRLFCIVLLIACTPCFSFPQEPTSVSRIETKYLKNVIAVTGKIISGGQPEKAESFAELRDLGIKTIVSVDGLKPDAVTAKKFGMRYVHLPNGYDGITAQRVLELAKAFRDLPGPIYIHCHHGKHRSPAAAASACVTLGLLTPQQASQSLKLAGTNPGFQGLFKAVEEATPASNPVLDSVQVDFLEVSPVPPMAEMMVAIDQVFSRLVDAKKQNWTQLDSNATDALMLKEHYVEAGRLDETKAQPAPFTKLLLEGTTLIDSLEMELRRASSSEDSSVSRSQSTQLLSHIESNCVRCHEQFRN